MKMRFLFLLIALVLFSNLHAQISRSDLDRMTTKGSTLLDKGKLEDAIEIFNDILTKDPTIGQALLLRARTKYELGAYKGAKKDCFAYMDAFGIDAEVAGLLGKVEKAMENFKQALAYLKTALLFDPVGEEYLLDRADILFNLGLDDKACDDWFVAMDNGSEIGRRKVSTHCRRYKKEKEEKEIKIEEVPVKEEDDTSNQSDSSDTEDDYTSNSPVENSNDDQDEDENEVEDVAEDTTDKESTEDGASSDNPLEEDEEDDTDEEEIEMEESYPIDESVEEIYIDDELTIVLADGIGSRKLIEKPDILILSDKSGEVVVNVCIDRLGRVQNPTLNEEYSTISAPSLISLALRESSNFRFARSSRKSHCGTITYSITGSE